MPVPPCAACRFDFDDILITQPSRCTHTALRCRNWRTAVCLPGQEDKHRSGGRHPTRFLTICLLPRAVVCAIAELLQLTSLHLLHGSLHPEVDVSHWTSLRSLAELKLLPGEEGGLRALQV